MYKNNYISVIIPALNEEQSLPFVLSDLNKLSDNTFRQKTQSLIDEIIVCDNGSTDRTADIANEYGAVVVHENQKGYGAACLRAIDALSPDCTIVVFIDADHSFYAKDILPMLSRLENQADLVIGSRYSGHCEMGAMTPTQIFGNRLATRLIKWLWKQEYSDLGPFRALKASHLKQLSMKDQAFGWTVEMQIKAIQHGMRIKELPVNTRCRIGKSKISGTLSGIIGAGCGIISKIFKLWYEQNKYAALVNKNKVYKQSN